MWRCAAGWVQGWLSHSVTRASRGTVAPAPAVESPGPRRRPGDLAPPHHHPSVDATSDAGPTARRGPSHPGPPAVCSAMGRGLFLFGGMATPPGRWLFWASGAFPPSPGDDRFLGWTVPSPAQACRWPRNGHQVRPGWNPKLTPCLLWAGMLLRNSPPLPPGLIKSYLIVHPLGLSLCV